MNETETLEQILQRIRAFIFDNYLFGYNENEFADDASFLDYGVMDSLGIMELIAFIEKEFSVEITDDEIVPDNLDSVSRVGRFVAQKTRALAAGGVGR
jgi:acyl carrier protein